MLNWIEWWLCEALLSDWWVGCMCLRRAPIRNLKISQNDQNVVSAYNSDLSSLNLEFGFLHTEKLCLHHPHVPVSLLSIQFRHYCQNSCITVEIAMPNTKWVDGHRRHHLVSFGHGGNSRPTEQALRDILSFCWRFFKSFDSGMFNHMLWLIVTFQDRWHPDASMIANRLEVAPPNILDLQDRERPSWAVFPLSWWKTKWYFPSKGFLLFKFLWRSLQRNSSRVPRLQSGRLVREEIRTWSPWQSHPRPWPSSPRPCPTPFRPCPSPSWIIPSIP